MIDRLRDPKRTTANYSTDRHAAHLATTAWLSARGYEVPPGFRWEVAIALDIVDAPAPAAFESQLATRFHLSIAPGEWGFFFCHGGKVSWIRVTDVVSVQDRDEHALFASVPPLRDIGTLIHKLEERHRFSFKREHAGVRTTIRGAEHTLRIWVAASM